MAGKPRKLAARVRLVEESAIALGLDLWDTTPNHIEGYLSGEHQPKAPLDLAWVAAVERVKQTMVALADLGDLLRARGGITGPGPLELARQAQEAAPTVVEEPPGP